MDDRIVAFLVVSTLLTITPGPDMALVARNVLIGGVRAGCSTSAGVLSGVVVWATLSAFGVAAILAASALAFTALKLAGAAYLIYLGVTTLWKARTPVEPLASHSRSQPRGGIANTFRQGLASNLLNPKVGVFYTTFLPQFIEPDQPVIARTALLTGLHLAVSVAWLVAFSWFVSVMRSALTKTRVRQAMERITGVALVGLGLRVARDGAR